VLNFEFKFRFRGQLESTQGFKVLNSNQVRALKLRKSKEPRGDRSKDGNSIFRERADKTSLRAAVIYKASYVPDVLETSGRPAVLFMRWLIDVLPRMTKVRAAQVAIERW